MKRLAIVALLLAVLTISVAPSMAGIDLNTAKNQKSTVDSKIEELNKAKKKALEEKAKLEQQKKAVANAQAAETNAYQELVNQISIAEENLRQTEAALAEAEANYNEQLETVKVRLKVMYQNSSVTKLEILLESKSLVEFYERLQYMALIAEHDNRLIEDLEIARQDVEYKRQLQQEAKAALEQQASESEKKLSSLKASRASLENDLARSTEALKKLEKEYDAMIARSKELNSIIKNLSKSTKKYTGGSMTWPVPSSDNVTSPFGMRKHPILRKVKMHTGIDIGATKNSAIVAANSGTVIMAQYDQSGGYGKMIVIDHGGGITTLYAHCNTLLVKVGDEVKAGQNIAKVGSTGLSTGYHLHFEVRKNGEPTNPLSSGYLSK